MIGDREDRDGSAVRDDLPMDDATVEHDLPPVDACLLFNPPPPVDGLRLVPAYVERRAQWVVIRHCWPEGDATTETPYPSVARALHGYARQVAALKGRGYTDATADW